MSKLDTESKETSFRENFNPINYIQKKEANENLINILAQENFFEI